MPEDLPGTKRINVMVGITRSKVINNGINLLLGSASKFNFWQYVNCVLKGNLIDFQSQKQYFFKLRVLTYQ